MSAGDKLLTDALSGLLQDHEADLAVALDEAKSLIGELSKMVRAGMERHHAARRPAIADRYLAAAGLLHQVALQVDTVREFTLGQPTAPSTEQAPAEVEAPRGSTPPAFSRRMRPLSRRRPPR